MWQRLGNSINSRDKSSVNSLPIFVSLQGRPVMLLGEGAVADAKARLLARAGAVVVRDEAAAASLAVIAMDDADKAEAAAARLKARGVLVNVVDRPVLCDFTLPAIVDRSPVIIAIATGASSASVAKALRQWLEAALPPTLGRLATVLKVARPALKARYPDASERRTALDRLLAPGGALDPLAEHAAPEDVLAQALAGHPAVDGNDYAEVVLTSTDPDDLTLRAARLLARADRVCHHADVPDAIIDRARADAERVLVDGPPQATGSGRSVYVRMAAG